MGPEGPFPSVSNRTAGERPRVNAAQGALVGRAGCPSWGHLAGSERTRGGCAVPRAEGPVSVCVQWTVTWSSWTWSTKSLGSSASCLCLLQPLPPLDPRVDLVSVATCHCFWVPLVLIAKKNLSDFLQTFSLDAVEVSVCAASYPFLRSRVLCFVCGHLTSLLKEDDPAFLLPSIVRDGGVLQLRCP